LKGKKQTLYLIGPLLNTAVRCESAVRQSASACNAGYRADRTVSLDVHGPAHNGVRPTHDPHGTHNKDNDVCGTLREGKLLTQRLTSNHQSVLPTS